MKTKCLLGLCRSMALIVAVVCPQLSSHAALYAYEGFSYTGDLIPAGGGFGQGAAGSGWEEPWYSGLVVGGFPVAASSLYPPTAAIAPTGGSIRQSLVTPANQYHALRWLTPLPINPGESLWLSAIMASSAQQGTRTLVSFEFSAIGGAAVRFDTMSPGTGLPLRWNFAGGSSDYGPEVTPDAPVLVVAEIHRDAVLDRYTFRYWINPGPTASPSGEPAEPPVATQITFGYFSTLYRVTLVANNNFPGLYSSLHQFDEIRIGSSYADINMVPNVAPVAVDDTASTLEDTSVNIPVLANDSDPNGDPLTVISSTDGANGTVTLNLDGTLNYTPSPNFNGADSFTYTISDGILAAEAAVIMSVAPVNDAPTVVADSVMTDEDTPVAVNVLANDGDVDGDLVVVHSVTQGAAGAVGVNPDGSVTYNPGPNFNGTDEFTYTASDGQGGEATTTVGVTVTPVNDPPVASDGTATVIEDTPTEIVLAASDVDGDALTLSVVTPPEHGTLGTMDGNRVIYTPAPNYSGPDSLTFRASDSLASADGVVRVTVGPVNDPPTLGPVSDQTVNEGTLLAFGLTAADPEGDTLTFSSSALPPGATLNPLTGEFAWTPDFTQAGSYPVTFSVADSSGLPVSTMISITVVDVPLETNHDPDCSLARPSLAEIAPPDPRQIVAIDILGVTDPDGDPVSVTITRILQDEPTNTLRDESTWVDGGGIGTPQALVRAERMASPRAGGNGRVYEIFFATSDGRGGTCSGSVKVGVPHDGGHSPATDDGVRYDSTVPGGPRVE